MGKLYGDALKDTLPESIANDKEIESICKVVQDRMWAIKKQTEMLLLLPRLNVLPEALIDELAWEYHVDFYRPDLPLDTKRKLIQQAIAWHRIKGTPAAIEEVCSAVFNHAEVFENWEYGGEPYHFKVRVVKEAIPDPLVIETLLDAIEQTKNARSWLDEIGFYREYLVKSFWGSGFSKRTSVKAIPRDFSIPKISKTLYCSSVALARKIYNLKAATFSFPEEGFRINNYLASTLTQKTRITEQYKEYKAPNVNTTKYHGAIVNIFRRYTVNG